MHPLAVRILETALEGDRFAPSELSAAWDEPLGNVSYHTRTLVNRGLLKAAGTRIKRGAVQHFYRIDEKALA